MKLYYPRIFLDYQVLELTVLRETIFCNYEKFYITQGCFLNPIRISSVGVEIVERDNIL
jgi:hypothetical protein